MNTDCFPPWLKRKVRNDIGPPIEDPIPYPVYQQQQPILSSDNPNPTSLYPGDAFFAAVSGQISPNNSPLNIVHIIPMNLYDTINIVAFDNNSTPGSNIVVPIFLSFDRPQSRITSEAAIQGSAEAFLITAIAFNAANPDQLPNFIGQQNLTVAPFYTCLYFETMKTNRPFYVWFNDSIANKASTNVNFKISWFTRGR